MTDSQLSSKEVKISNKFKKYLMRMTQVIDGACKKIPNTTVRVNNHSLVIGQYVQNGSLDYSF